MICKYTKKEYPFSECDWSKINWCRQCKIGSEQRFMHRKAIALSVQIRNKMK